MFSLLSSLKGQSAKSGTSIDASEAASLRYISWWLFGMCALVFLMVIVGGATRLTDSGLSITEWKPVVGALPPLSDADWLSEFEKYKQIPEYRQVNFGMSLSEFKEIYWWEWGHRLLGRVIGFAFLLPFLFFLVTRQLSKSLMVRLGGLFLLGGAQGFLGWYMVKSGLAQRVDVSQYRLAAHLGLAVILFILMAWLALELRWRVRQVASSRLEEKIYLNTIPPKLKKGVIALTVLVYFQIILGAFVAGLRAGFTFNSWPLMDGQFFPVGYFSATPALADLFESIAAVQFNHRLMAYILVVAGSWFLYASWKTELERYGQWLASAIFAQMLLGIVTLLAVVPLWLGLAHQAGAMIVLFIAVTTLHRSLRV